MFKSRVRNEYGFSMIEMMVVMVVIGVLIGGGIKFYQGYIENSRVTKAKTQISILQASLDGYYSENFAYPKGSNDLVNIGIRVANASGLEFTLNANDPWGSAYVYKCTTDAKKYVIYTGYDKVQNPSGEIKQYVVGKGENGNAGNPLIETHTDGTAPAP